jgi:hypothetical protein
LVGAGELERSALPGEASVEESETGDLEGRKRKTLTIVGCSHR